MLVQDVEKSFPGERFSLAEPSLLCDRSRNRHQARVGSLQNLFARRRIVVFREVVHAGATERLRAPIKGFRLRVLAVGLGRQGRHSRGVGFIGTAVDLVSRPPSRIGASARFLNQGFNAVRIGLALANLPRGNCGPRQVRQRIDHRAALALSRGGGGKSIERFGFLPGVPERTVAKRDELHDAADPQKLPALLGRVQGFQPVLQSLLVAAEQRSGGATVVIELRCFRRGCRARGRGFRGRPASGDLCRVWFLLIEDRSDVGGRARRRHERRANQSGLGARGSGFVHLRRRRRRLSDRLLLLFTQDTGFHEGNADGLTALLAQRLEVGCSAALLNARDHGRAGGLFARLDNLFMGRRWSEASGAKKDGRASQAGGRSAKEPTLAHAFVPATVRLPGEFTLPWRRDPTSLLRRVLAGPSCRPWNAKVCSGRIFPVQWTDGNGQFGTDTQYGIWPSRDEIVGR